MAKRIGLGENSGSRTPTHRLVLIYHPLKLRFVKRVQGKVGADNWIGGWPQEQLSVESFRPIKGRAPRSHSGAGNT
jgi:hypothetical protein